MTRRARQLRQTFFLGLALLIGGMLSVTTYTLWRLHAEAVGNGLNISEMHARSFEDFLTQSLHVTELAAANIAPPDDGAPDLRRVESGLAATLRRAPYLRSMSLLDDSGRIVASSNPANIGLTVATQSYLPAASETQEILRIGRPWAGRDFADGRPATAQTPVQADAQSFIPVTRTLAVGERWMTLLVALNPDYFIHHMTQALDAKEGSVEILRYDGTLLLDTDPTALPGSLHADVVRDLRLTAVESGKFEQTYGNGRQFLTAFRASHLYPFVVVTHLHREAALQSWRTEAKTLLGTVIPSLLLITLLAIAFYRRQLLLAAQRVEAERLQRINATVFDASAEAIIITDLNANIISVNAAFTRISGFTADEVMGRNPRLLASGQQDKGFYENLWSHLLRDGVWAGEMINRRKDGGIYDVQMTITVSHDGAGCLQHFIGVTRDITERRLAEEKLHLAASVFSHSREGIMITAADGTIIDVNDAFTHITGYHRDEVLGQNPRILSSGRQSQAFYASMWRGLIDKGHWYGEVWNRRKNGEVFAEMQTISTVLDAHGKPLHYVSLFSDISALKAHQKQLEHIAHFDALTSLPNRVLLADRMHQAIAQTQRRGQLLAVAYLDLDGFKSVNDRHGHEAGDQLLIALASRMKQALREGDTLARIGGDEFVAVLLDLPDVAASVPMLNRLLAAAAQPVHFGELVLQVSASLGVTFYPQAEDADADLLLRQADQAMYQAKLAGKNRYHVFDAEQDRSVRGHHESVERIRRALAEGEFMLYYQPKVNMRKGTVIGAEALIRWQHPDKGLLAPSVFLPVIEDHPLAIDIGEWVIDAALTQMERWRKGGLTMPVSVNIGARQLQQVNFVERLRAILSAHPQVKPGDLELEVLETSALEDLAHVSHVIEACREIGVMFALDDFGTGYSSLTYLKRLPVTLLKIDQSFVRGMLDDPDDLAILEGVIGLASAFRRQVIAEGVETVAHGAMLLQLGCEQAQGYGIARPMPAADLPGWSADWRTDPSWADLPPVNRDDLPLLFASVEHRAWVVAVTAFLKGELEALAPQKLNHCRFGQWLNTEGLARYGAHASFQAIEPLHQQIHALAETLVALQAKGHRAEALSRLGELYALRDSLLQQLKTLRQQHRPLDQGRTF
ncbi:EAL domain-containing protein [Rhodoferax ferrireducens]|uniref:EAL domain-containing protein n=1 Tax=Rhodoferax ferrireducens TaxID=192843 RepID=UPI0018E4FE26|nr:EAL domain-containing protein [Rhodoferax ferrireducens]